MSVIHDIVIIGGGPAGYCAALYSARAGFDTLILEKSAPGGQMMLTDVIDNYPGFEEGVDGVELSMKMLAGAERFGAVTEYCEVTGVELSGEVKKLSTNGGDIYARAVIIATGAEPRKLAIEGEDAFLGRGIHYCAHCDGRFYKDKTVAVIGGGNSAVSDALYLSKLAKKVLLVHRRDSLRATQIYHKPLFEAQNVEFMFNQTADSLLTDTESGKLTGIRLKSSIDESLTDVDCDGIFVSIGREPITSFLGDALPLEAGYILANENTKTDVAGVFAAGDVRKKELRQIVTAVADGAIAAHAAEEYLGGY